MKEHSAGKMLETWRWKQNWQVCVWIDNCYIKQYGTHQTIRDQSQNCTALCVVQIPCRVPYFRGHPNVDVRIGSIGSVAAAFVRMKRSFHGIVTDLGLLADRPAAIPSIRARVGINKRCLLIFFGKLTNKRTNERTMKINEHRLLIFFLVNVLSVCF